MDGRDAVRMTRVAFQGERGAFSEEAVRAWFGDRVELEPRREFRDVAAAVAGGGADFGLLPVENSLAGSVGPALDALLGADLEIEAEVVIPIRLCLMAPRGAVLDGVRRVLSHPVALAQCLGFFRERPGLEAVAVHDTAGAARMVAEAGDPALAAVASEAAAERWGLDVLARDLQDRSDNRTRFLVVRAEGRPPLLPTVSSPKSLVAFETADRPGALADVLRAFADRGVNLSRLESRPGRVPWTYRFVAEVAADLRAGPGLVAVEDARAHALTLVVRGPFEAAAQEPGAEAGGLAAEGPEAAPPDADAGAGLDRVRAAIDDVDEILVRLLAERMRLARRAQTLRAGGGRGGVDPAREARVMRRAGELARRAGLPEEAVRDVFWRVIGLCGRDHPEGTGGGAP